MYPCRSGELYPFEKIAGPAALDPFLPHNGQRAPQVTVEDRRGTASDHLAVGQIIRAYISPHPTNLVVEQQNDHG